MDAYLIHRAGRFTLLGSIVAECQVIPDEYFDKGKNELNGLGFKPGDSIPVTIASGKENQ